MLLFVDSEGEPIQEFTALYVNKQSREILDVFHRHVAFPSCGYDTDHWPRRHIHGLQRAYLAKHGLRDEGALRHDFSEWLRSHPYDEILANDPSKESVFLNLPISDVCLPPWQDRGVLSSHQRALSLKRRAIPINGITCSSAHSHFLNWLPRRPHAPSPTDVIKRDFGHHCSLYDCMELYFFISIKIEKTTYCNDIMCIFNFPHT